MTPSLAGLIGAALGLYLGWLDGKIVAAILGARAERLKGEGQGSHFLVRYQARIRVLILGFSMIGFSVVGYWAGVSFSG